MVSMMARIKAVCISEKKGSVKQSVHEALCVGNHGLLNDAHAGGAHRQVSLMSLMDIKECGQEYPSLEYGVYAENLLIDGERLRYLPIGSRIIIQDVILEVTQIGKECHRGCIIKQKKGKCLMSQIGVFAKVVHGGLLHEGDEVVFEIPQKLERQCSLFTLDEQHRFMKQPIVIVGLGGLGQIVAEQLVRCGFYDLTLIDNDRISYSNFNRQIYANHETIHCSKVAVVQQELLKIEPLCKIKTYEMFLDKQTSLDLIPDGCILVDCCDNVRSKLLMEEIANQKQVPLVHGAVDGWYGQVATILPSDQLLGRLYRNKELEGGASFTITVHMVACFQVKEVIQLTLQRETLYHAILWIDAYNNTLEITKL